MSSLPLLPTLPLTAPAHGPGGLAVVNTSNNGTTNRHRDGVPSHHPAGDQLLHLSNVVSSVLGPTPTAIPVNERVTSDQGILNSLSSQRYPLRGPNQASP